MSSPSHTPSFTKLNNSNYLQWKDDMEAWLRSVKLWRLVSGVAKAPQLSSSPTPEELSALELWEDNKDRAAGTIMLWLEQDQKVHVSGIRDDPIAMWKKLESVHQAQRPGNRFNAYDDLFSIRKLEGESLQSLVNRVESAMQNIKNLRPVTFTLDHLDDELCSMAMIRALPEEYSSFTSSLMLLDKLDKATLQQAFHTEETQRRRRAEIEGASIALAKSHHSLHCTFCKKDGHVMKRCYAFIRAQAKASKHMDQKKESAQKTETGSANIVEVVESAGSASSQSSTTTARSDSWNADTGATSPMTPHRHWIRNYKPYVVPVKLADDQIVYSAGVGTVMFKPVINGKECRPVEFSRVLHVPKLRSNLLSVLYLTRNKGVIVIIDSKQLKFKKGGNVLFTADIDSNNTAYLNGVTVLPLQAEESTQIASTLPMDLTLWHRRLAHHNHDDVLKLHKEKLVHGMTLVASGTKPDPICEPCLAGKMHANPFPLSKHRAKKPLELVHSDLHGPTQTRTHSGYRYWISFIDDYSRYRVVYLLKAKSEAFDAFKRFKALAENQLDAKIKTLRDDKGGEYMSNAFTKFTDDAGIVRQHTVRNRPQQNGVAERANRTMEERIVALLKEANLPHTFWGECLMAMVHVWNRCPTSAIKKATPYQLWFKRKPSVDHIRVWGCTAYVHVQKDKRTDFGSHMEKCVFIGYPEGYKGWKFYNPSSHRTVISERADFDERYFPGLKKTISNPTLLTQSEHNQTHTQSQPSPVALIPDVGGEDIDMPPLQHHLPQVQPPPVVPVPVQPDPPERVPTPPLALRRTPRIRRPPGEWWKVPPAPAPAPIPEVPEFIAEPEPSAQDSDTSADELDVIDAGYTAVEFAGLASGADPRMYSEAMSSPDASHWKQATIDEINSLVANGTWEIVKLPPGKKAIGSGWVFKVKKREDGSIERYKARVVAKGCSQRPGFDYVEVFAPTCRLATIRLILAIAAIEDLHVHSVDISSAFLNGDLEEEIYMKQPQGFVQFGSDYVCRLQKAIYGLKQAGRQWNKKLHQVLSTMGFRRLESDRSIYIYLRDNVRIIIPVFVDDITLASSSQKAIDDTVKELSRHFKLRDLGPTNWLLRMEIIRNRSERRLALSQRQYIIDMLERYKLTDCKAVSTPMDPGVNLTVDMGATTPEDVEFMRSVPYLNAVGALMYLAQCTRPDIAYAVGVLARFSMNPGIAHWKAVKHLFRYLQGTKDLALVYKPDTSTGLFTTFSDANHGGCKDSGRSTGGYVVSLGSAAISWSSKLQPVVALSTTEAEYIAAVEAGKEILWMRNILTELGYNMDSPSVLMMDNQSAISVSKNPEHHGRMKHLDLRWYWLRDVVDAKQIMPNYVPTNEMVADILTKSLPREKVQRCRGGMGLEGLEELERCTIRGEC